MYLVLFVCVCLFVCLFGWLFFVLYAHLFVFPVQFALKYTSGKIAGRDITSTTCAVARQCGVKQRNVCY